MIANVTVDIGPNVVTAIGLLITFATLVFNGIIALKTRATVKEVLAEQKPNDGHSQRDAINRIEEHAKVAAEAAVAAAQLPPPPPPAA